MNLTNGFFGVYPNQTLEFLPGIDGEDRYKKSLLELGESWTYKKLKVTYSFNQLGHRCKNLNELEEDYILFTGCSLTTGVGVPVESSYPHITSGLLGMDYYSTAVAGSGVEQQLHNLTAFLIKMRNKLPKIVVIQHPDANRFFTVNNHRYDMSLYNAYSSDDDIKKVMYENGVSYMKSMLYRQLMLACLKEFNITHIIETGDNIDDGSMLTDFPKADFILTQKIGESARDLTHPGIASHLAQAEHIVSLIKKLQYC